MQYYGTILYHETFPSVKCSLNYMLKFPCFLMSVSVLKPAKFLVLYQKLPQVIIGPLFLNSLYEESLISTDHISKINTDSALHSTRSYSVPHG